MTDRPPAEAAPAPEPPVLSPWRWAAVGVTAALLMALSLALGLDAGGFQAWVWLLMVGSVVAGFLVVASAWLLRQAMPSRGLIWAGLALAVLFRLALLPTDRYLSDDAYRYHWDGKVVAHGVNPYTHPPRAKALDGLRTDDLDRLINHPQHRTVYPPLAQAYFALGYTLSPGRLLGIQVLILLSELAAWLLLLGALRRQNRSGAWVLLAAWAPLVLFESYLPGHLDTLGLPWLVLFVIGLERRQPWLAGVALAATLLIKPLPIIFVPVALVHLGWRRSLKFSLALVAVMALAYLPVLSAGEGLVESLWLMARKWSMNGSLAAVLEATLPKPTARLVAAGILSALLLAAPWIGKSLNTRLLVAWTAFVICTPNLYAWYAIWMLPLLVLRPDPALLALAILLPLSEVVNIDWRLHRIWKVPLWPSLVLYSVFYPLLLLSAYKRWGMFTRAPAHSERT